MANLHVGTAGFTAPRGKYQSRLRFVEVDLRSPAPSPKSLAGWKKQSPEGFVFSVVAPASLYGAADWPLRDANALRSELDRLANNVRALGAEAVVLRTPMAITPGSAALKRLLPVFEQVKKFSPLVVWEPVGVWEHEDALAAVGDADVVVASDPLRDAPEAPVVYARLRGLGGDHRYTMGRLEALAEALAGVDEAFVVFSSQESWREAVGFARLAGELASSEGDDEDDDLDDEDDDLDDEDEEDEG